MFEWYWHVKIFPIFSKIVAAIFAVLSLFLVIGETTLFINTKAGIFPYFFEKDHGPVGTQIICFFPMAYIFCTTYIGLFTLRIPGSYGLYNKNHTDPANLVWSSFFTTRLVQPLIYNFLLIIKVPDTQFQKVIIVVFAMLNLLDFYTWLMVKLGVPQLSFAENFDAAKMEEGRELLKKGKG